ncbi:hypothetical protein MHBO_002957, partial [Bonamia ostreae]
MSNRQVYLAEIRDGSNENIESRRRIARKCRLVGLEYNTNQRSNNPTLEHPSFRNSYPSQQQIYQSFNPFGSFLLPPTTLFHPFQSSFMMPYQNFMDPYQNSM